MEEVKKKTEIQKDRKRTFISFFLYLVFCVLSVFFCCGSYYLCAGLIDQTPTFFEKAISDNKSRIFLLSYNEHSDRKSEKFSNRSDSFSKPIFFEGLTVECNETFVSLFETWSLFTDDVSEPSDHILGQKVEVKGCDLNYLEEDDNIIISKNMFSTFFGNSSFDKNQEYLIEIKAGSVVVEAKVFGLFDDETFNPSKNWASIYKECLKNDFFFASQKLFSNFVATSSHFSFNTTYVDAAMLVDSLKTFDSSKMIFYQFQEPVYSAYFNLINKSNSLKPLEISLGSLSIVLFFGYCVFIGFNKKLKIDGAICLALHISLFVIAALTLVVISNNQGNNLLIFNSVIYPYVLIVFAISLLFGASIFYGKKLISFVKGKITNG